jgi:2,5-diamino-6-(ribosylamino)-4(3H)-pyrimidinone 5'-phosphate reductase
VNRPHVMVHTVASVDGRVSLGPGRTGFDDVGDERWQAIWASGTSLEESVRTLVSEHSPDVLLEGSGSFVREGEELSPLSPPASRLGASHGDYLPEAVVCRPGHRGWFAVVDGRGRLRSGMKEFPGWEGWHTLHLVCAASPPEYLAFLRRREIPYLTAGDLQVDLVEVMGKLTTLLGVERVVCTAGSRLNGALLRAGLVDEISLVLLPALIGGSDTPVLFRSPDLGPEEWPARLRLLSVDAEPTGRVKLHYQVLSQEESGMTQWDPPGHVAFGAGDVGTSPSSREGRSP